MRKLSIKIWPPLILVFSIAIVFIIYLNWPKTEKFPEISFPEIAPKEKIPEIPADWKTYRNEEYGFEFRYPTFWKVWSEGKTDDFSFISFESSDYEDPGYTIPRPSAIEIKIIDNAGLTTEEYFNISPGKNFFKPLYYEGSAELVRPPQVINIAEHKIYIVCPLGTLYGDCEYIVPFKKHFFVVGLCLACTGDSIQKAIITSLKVDTDF